MSWPGKDGAWVSSRNIARFECTKCGNWYTSTWSMNEREVEDQLREHLRDKHGGVFR